ncbi:MAG TPA: asparagine synthase C-terminal domain-containing protein, partial [Candidatus Acidoferrum sp.]|nr:asparagine synthase C-terminal domain-containing protein [Candidatus Acidoferrum sp.]
IGFDYERYDELPHAQRIADQFRTDHLAHVVRADAAGILERIVWHLDEPFGDPSVIPTYYLAKLTRERVTVALSGDGGDEVFAGYDFRYLPTQAEFRLRRMLPLSFFSPLLRSAAAIYPSGRRVPRPLRLKTILRNLSVSPEEAHAYDISFIAPDLRQDLYVPEFTRKLGGFSPEELVLAVFRKSTARHWLNRALYVDAKFYMQNDVLTKVDRMSMANSLEVRSPLLDQRIMELTAAVPAAFKLKGTRCKHILKEAMKDCLDPRLLERPKQGFSIPLAEWLRGGCRDYAAGLLLDPQAFIHRFVRPSAVQRLWNFHQKGDDYGSELWSLLMLELWGTVYLKSVREAPRLAAEATPPLPLPHGSARAPAEAALGRLGG